MTETFDALLKEATQARDETDAAGTEAKENPAGEGREKHLYELKNNSTKEGVEFFKKDKYFDRQIDKWKDLADGVRVKVGELEVGSALNRIGFPAGGMWFDTGKIRQELEIHGDHLTKTILKRIPDLLRDPIAIVEHRGAKGDIDNTVPVYGLILPDGKTHVAVGVVMVRASNGNLLINKIRTVHARSNARITDENILYLNEDKKRAQKWFQVCGISVPLDGNKFGLIRSIEYVPKNVKTNFENLNSRDKKYSSSEKAEEHKKKKETEEKEKHSIDLEAEAEEALEREAEGDVRVLEAQDVLRRTQHRNVRENG